jgi:signal transduction histidine kinase
VKAFREHWLGAVVVLAIAAAAGLAASTLVHGAYGAASYAGLVPGTAACTAWVAASFYRSRRDPALLFIAAGSGALAVGALVAMLSHLVAAAPNDVSRSSLGALAAYAPVLGLAAFVACLDLAVPWRDRRGRPPLRVRSVITPVAMVMGIGIVALYWIEPAYNEAAFRGALVLIGAAAGLAAARSVARGGWHAWVGAGAFALTIATWGLVPALGETTSTRLFEAGAVWYTLLPAVAALFVLIGVLAAQRAESTRSRRASDRATQVMEGRAEIASIVAHDVRGPAGTIRSVAGSLRTSYERLGDPERLEFVGMIEQESQRLLRVADQMSLGLKTDAGTLAYAFVERDLEGPVLQALHEADVGAREVRVDVDGAVRAPIDGRWVTEATRQGLENAMKFSPPEAPIDLRVRGSDVSALIEVEDQGPGVPDELHDQVFQKFCRWRPIGYEDKQGSGLGLFIVRSIARQHDGDATIANRPDGGTILQIRLPLEGAK